MHYFSTEYILFHIGDYPLSLIELVGTIFGLLSVWWAARANILTWPAGILNEIGFFVLFYQVQLYADMLLQVFFFVVTIYGWQKWRAQKDNQPLAITRLSQQWRGYYLLFLIIGTILLGYFNSQFHILWPSIFPEPAAYPYPDAFTTMASVLATFLLANKKWEAWLFWVIIDVICIILYFKKGIYVVAWEYVVFLVIASFGLYQWYRVQSRG